MSQSNEDQWKQIRPMITMQGMLAYSLIYLWKRRLDNHPGPIPDKWHTYSVLEIIEWCRADAEEEA